jgi:hypothetical protein
MAVDKEVKKPAPSNEANEEKDKEKKTKNKEPPKEAELVILTNRMGFHFSIMNLTCHF